MRVVLFLFLLVFSAFSTLEAVAQTAPYKVRPGDTLDITVWQDPKLNRRVIVEPDGRVAFPLAGSFQAGGRPVSVIEATLKQLLAKSFAEELDISVSLVQKEEPQVPPEPEIDPSFYVTGEVAKPGQFAFKTPTNVLQAIAMSGGLGPFAASKRIKIRRIVDGEERLYDFNYDAFISGQDMSGNMQLDAGDVVIVPEKWLFE